MVEDTSITSLIYVVSNFHNGITWLPKY